MRSVNKNDSIKKRLFIYGCGGLGKEFYAHFCESFYSKLYYVAGFVDDYPTESTIFGIKVFSSSDFNFLSDDFFVICISDPNTRIKISYFLKNAKVKTPNFIFGSVVGDVSLGKGIIVFKDSIINTLCKVEDFVIICQKAIIGHESTVGEYSTLYPLSFVAGNVTVGKCCQLGANSAVIQNISICNNVIIGAGSTVIESIDNGGTYVGSPTRRIK